MEFVTVVAFASAVFAGFSILLNFGVIRRLRELQDRFPLGNVPSSLPRTGQRVGTFQARTLAGVPMSERDLAESSTLIGFFSTDCSPCRRLRDQLLTEPPAERMTAFVVTRDEKGGERDAMSFARDLALAADVAIVPVDGTTTRAFDVRGYPTLLRVTEGVITAAGHRLADVLTRPSALAGQTE